MKFKMFEIQMFGSIKISNDINNYSSHSSRPSNNNSKLGRINEWTQKVTLWIMKNHTLGNVCLVKSQNKTMKHELKLCKCEEKFLSDTETCSPQNVFLSLNSYEYMRRPSYQFNLQVSLLLENKMQTFFSVVCF